MFTELSCSLYVVNDLHILLHLVLTTHNHSNATKWTEYLSHYLCAHSADPTGKYCNFNCLTLSWARQDNQPLTCFGSQVATLHVWYPHPWMWTRESDSGKELGRINSVREEGIVSFWAYSDMPVYVSEYHGVSLIQSWLSSTVITLNRISWLIFILHMSPRTCTPSCQLRPLSGSTFIAWLHH